MSPLAFFVHAIAGREALVEGATSTAQSGYSMRLGVKALESTITEYDYTLEGTWPHDEKWGGEGVTHLIVGSDILNVPVRDGAHIIQFTYNGSGLDPKYQAQAGTNGAFTNLPAALDTWHYNHMVMLEKKDLVEEKGPE